MYSKKAGYVLASVLLLPVSILHKGPKGKPRRLCRASASSTNSRYPNAATVSPANVACPMYMPLRHKPVHVYLAAVDTSASTSGACRKMNAQHCRRHGEWIGIHTLWRFVPGTSSAAVPSRRAHPTMTCGEKVSLCTFGDSAALPLLQSAFVTVLHSLQAWL